MRVNSGRSLKGLMLVMSFVTGLSACSESDLSGKKDIDQSDDPSGIDSFFYADSISVGGTMVRAHIDCSAGLIYTPDDTITFAEIAGTICCIDGPKESLPGDTISLYYNSDQVGPGTFIRWLIYEGDLVQLSGEHDQSAVFICGGGFSGGSIIGSCVDSTTNNERCSDIKHVMLSTP